MKKKRRRYFKIFVLSFLILICLAVVFRIDLMIERGLYPLKYEEMILTETKEFELDPYLVMAIIYAESDFQADAISRVGAVGLMQLMPSTAMECAKKLDMDGFIEEQLVEPDVNIRLGCFYIMYLQKSYGLRGNAVIAAYNAGPNKVREWLKDGRYSKDGISFTKIPYVETDEYVVKVNKAYDIYKKLYTNVIQAS